MAQQTPAKRRPPLVARRPVRVALYLLLVVGLVGGLDTFCHMQPLEALLARAVELDPVTRRHSPTNDLAAPHGILDLQLAFGSTRASEIVTAWQNPHLVDPEAKSTGGALRPAALAAAYRDLLSGPLRARLAGRQPEATGNGPPAAGPICLPGRSLIPCAKKSLRLDSRLILFYVLLLGAACLLAAKAFTDEGRRGWYLISALPLAAGLLDLVENDLLLWLLAEGDSLAPWTAAVAVVKLTLLAAVLIALVIVGFARFVRWWNAPRTKTAAPLSKVMAAERQYLVQRRLAAGAPPEGPAVGLALSGGGIRSATLNLGVLQALARRRVLPHVDYLSTVSGGGYIGSCLSSLLSINSEKLPESAAGDDDQYVFEKNDASRFATTFDRFPFNERDDTTAEGCRRLDGASQMRHLRAAGEFLVGRRQLLSVEMLRAVGSVTVGILYHLLHFGLFMVAAAACYLWVVYQMVGDPSKRPSAESALPGDPLHGASILEATPLLEQYRDYLGQAFGYPWPPGEIHPFLIAALVGFAATGLGLLLSLAVLRRLPDDWFARSGLTVSQARNLAAVLAMLVTMVTVGFGVLTPWFRTSLPHNLLNISIPLASYLGGGAVLVCLHAWVKASPRFRRTHRSRLAAQEGAFVLLTLVSLVLVMVILPFLVFFDPLVEYLEERPVRSVASWLLALLGARTLAGGDQDAKAQGAFAKVLSKVPGLRKVVLSVVVFVAVVGGVLLFCVVIWKTEPETGTSGFRLAVSLVALALFGLTGWLDFNRLALHFFYRDRLAEAYLRTTCADPEAGHTLEPLRDNEALRLEQLHGRRRRGEPRECVTGAPYHLLVTCLNLSADERPSQATRKTDQFLFSRLYCGSDTTGFQESWSYRAGDTKLADAMTISGAAASPAMGRRSFFAQSVAMTLFNVRLGQWLENPAWIGGTLPRRTFWPFYLAREIVGACNADGRLVYLSDGGHSGDNVGIYPLLKRRCRLIVAVDAEEDSAYTSNSLVEALRQIRIDEGIEVDIDLAPLRPVDGKPSPAHFACGTIHYPPPKAAGDATKTTGDAKDTAKIASREKSAAKDDGDKIPDAESGTLIVLKSSLTGEEPELIGNYQRNNGAFPHQSTGDLFFDDAQFEAYRQLGEHMVESMLDSCPAAVTGLPPLGDKA